MDWIGTTLEGRYELQQELGAGGMGSVYLARDVRLDRRVVVKIPHTDLLQDEQFRTRFLSEVRGMSRLEHAHVIKIHDAGEHERVPFAVVQFVGGGDLRGRVPRGESQTPEEVLEWVRPVAAALDFVHQKNHVHRDVKPGNILFDSNGFPYLSDFGIATVMKTAEDTQDGQLTQIGTFVGSPVYSPPEALARELSPQYDQYSLAVVLYEMLSGAFPYDARSATQVMGAKIRDDPKPLLEIAPDVPPAAAEVVMKGLARDPRHRFDSCIAMVDAFEQAVRNAPAAQPAGPAPSAQATQVGGMRAIDAGLATGPRQRSGGGLPSWLFPAGVGLAGLLVVGGLIYVLLGRMGGGEQAQTQDPGGNAPVREEQPQAPVRNTKPVQFRGGATSSQLQASVALCEAHLTAGTSAADCAEMVRTEGQRAASTLTPFAMDDTEVTAAAFASFVDATGYETQAEKAGLSYHGMTPFGPRKIPGATWKAPDGEGSSWQDHRAHPVIHVSAEDAEAYCAHDGGRLPTQDEWEYASRGTSGQLFPWGDDWAPDRALWGGTQADSPGAGMRPVGSFEAGRGPLGDADLAGSVWEWTATEVKDEAGQPMRILKGGSWLSENPAFLRSTAQLELYLDDTESAVGFRCVRDTEAWPE